MPAADPTIIAAVLCMAGQLAAHLLAFLERRSMAKLIVEKVTDPKRRSVS